MNKSIVLTTTLAMMFSFIAYSCSSTPDRMESAQADLIEAERSADMDRSEIEADLRIYRQETAETIRENNVSIAEIKEEIAEEEADIRAVNEVRIADYERTNRDLKRQIDNYRITNKENWNEFKADFSSSMDDLGSSLDDFFSRPTTSR